MLSWNATHGTLERVDPSVYQAPLLVTAGVNVAEMVFWSTTYNLWIVLVRGHTDRSWPPTAQTREVDVDELPHYAQIIGA